MNKVLLYGKIESEPQLKEFGEGEKVATFSLSTVRRYRKNGQFKTKKEIHFLCSFDERALYAMKSLHTGDSAIIEGELSYRDFETKEGVKKQRTEVHVLFFKLVSSEKKSKIANQSEPTH